MSTPKTPMERAEEYMLKRVNMARNLTTETYEAYLAGAQEEAAIKDSRIEALKTRISKLREALESYDFGPGTIGHDTLKNDDQLSAQDAR